HRLVPALFHAASMLLDPRGTQAKPAFPVVIHPPRPYHCRPSAPVRSGVAPGRGWTIAPSFRRGGRVVDKFAGSEFGQPKGWPRAKRGVSLMDETSTNAS